MWWLAQVSTQPPSLPGEHDESSGQEWNKSTAKNTPSAQLSDPVFLHLWFVCFFVSRCWLNPEMFFSERAACQVTSKCRVMSGAQVARRAGYSAVHHELLPASGLRCVITGNDAGIYCNQFHRD